MWPEAVLDSMAGIVKGPTRHGPALLQHIVLLKSRIQTADPRADNHTDAAWVFVAHLEARVLHRLYGSGGCKVGVTIQMAHIAPVHIGLRVKALDFGGNLNLELAGVKRSDLAYTTAAGDEVIPHGGHVVADGRHRADAGHDNSLMIC